jgi:hypothetical protein
VNEMNVFDQARDYIEAYNESPSDPYKINPNARYMASLLRDINGNGMRIAQRDGYWVLMASDDNRKKWRLQPCQ